jgi:succinate dehydrogenase / fumarate reductase membrane anchor subunit
MNLRTPLAKVRGLGSARHGTHHFWYQRLSAVALVPLTLWATASMLRLTSTDHAAVSAWMSIPFNALLLLLLIAALFYHAQLGVQVVIEDYIDSEWQKLSCIILIKFLALLGGTASALAVLKVFLGL